VAFRVVAALVVIALIGTLLVGLATGAVLRWRARQMAAAVRDELGPGRVRLVEPVAELLGLSSAGRNQPRGNGTLAASDEEVLFAMWVPRRTLRINRADIVAVDTPRSHRGRTRFRPLLRITYRDGAGRDERAAWAVGDLDAWLTELGRPSSGT